MHIITPEMIEREIADLVSRGYTEREALGIVAGRYPDLDIQVTVTPVVEDFESSEEWYDSGCSIDWDDSGC